MTHYIVLRKTGDGWFIAGHANASNPHSARKAVVPDTGEYLVVPVRNATFISGTVVQPEPKAVSVEVSADTYLDVQETLIGEATGEPREGIEVPADGTEVVLDAA